MAPTTRRYVMSALLCSSTTSLLTHPLRRPFQSLRWWRSTRPGPWSQLPIPGTSPSPTAGLVDLKNDRRPVIAVLAPGRPPERVVAEAAALAAQRGSPLRFLVLRRMARISTDAALVAVTEHAAGTAQRELLSRAASAVLLTDVDDRHDVAERQVTIEADVVRVSGTDFSAPSAWVTRRVLATARRRGAGVVVLPAVLLGADAVPHRLVLVPVEDLGGDSAPADAVRMQVQPRSAPARLVDPPGTGLSPRR